MIPAATTATPILVHFEDHQLLWLSFPWPTMRVTLVMEMFVGAQFVAAGSGHYNLKCSHLAVRCPAGGGRLAVGVRPVRLGIFLVSEARAGAFQGEAEHYTRAFHRLIVLVDDLDDQGAITLRSRSFSS